MRWLGRFFGKALLPLLSYADKRDWEALRQLEESFNGIPELGGSFKCYAVTTQDNVELNTISFTKKDQKPEKYIINFMGSSSSCFEYPVLVELMNDAEHCGVTSIAFDYRGIGTNFCGPESGHDLVQDGIARH